YPFNSILKTNVYIAGNLLPNAEIVSEIQSLNENEALYSEENKLLAFHVGVNVPFENIADAASSLTAKKTNVSFLLLEKLHHIFSWNGAEISSDFTRITKGRKSQPLSSTNILIGSAENLFIEEGAVVEASVLNTKKGVIYIGKNAEIMENCAVRAPFALGEEATLKMSSKIYGDTTIGAHCKVGGEVSNSVFFPYSNKGHDGFLGNSVIGEWCNLGADTNTSNLKNNYASVDVWNYAIENYEQTGLQFHGLIMGDHAKSGINTMFNTGTVVGVSANVFGSGFPKKFIPSFTWGAVESSYTFQFEKALEVSKRMMERRHIELSASDIEILRVAFEKDAKFRK
ncbi:MAG TPA: putative sugar nucleotidyl transferase, partial [Chitinophagales bacterium]